MADDKPIQKELDDAEADLEQKIGQLKIVVLDKLERPRRAIDALERTGRWLGAHPWLAVAVGVGLGALIVVTRRPR